MIEETTLNTEAPAQETQTQPQQPVQSQATPELTATPAQLEKHKTASAVELLPFGTWLTKSQEEQPALKQVSALRVTAGATVGLAALAAGTTAVAAGAEALLDWL